METFTKLFGSLLIFVYHCFDRVVIHGYLSGLSRSGQVVHFFHDVVGEPVIDKAVLSRRTNEYQGWVEAYARNRCIPIEWAEPKARKEDSPTSPGELRAFYTGDNRGVGRDFGHNGGGILGREAVAECEGDKYGKEARHLKGKTFGDD